MPGMWSGEGSGWSSHVFLDHHRQATLELRHKGDQESAVHRWKVAVWAEGGSSVNKV